MAPPVVQLECQFVNLTSDPAVGRDERRTHVRRAVMTDYHKRRRKHGKDNEQAPDQDKPAPQLTKQAPVAVQSHPNGLLGRKNWQNGGHAQTSQLIIRFMCGQVTKAARDLCDVSFIHRQSKELSEVTGIHPNPLRLCQHTLRRYCDTRVSAGLEDARLWADIQQQQERIYIQSDTWDAWDLLSAAQAMTLYLLLRLKRKTNHSSFPGGDIALLWTLGKTFKILQEHHLHDILSHSSSIVNGWETWIFHESVMRTAMVYFILTLVVSTDFGLPCDRPSDWEIDDLPLPSTKASWIAQDKAAWNDSFDQAFRLPYNLTFGHLCNNKDLHQSRIEEWQEASDELGLVVTMASHLKTAVM